MLSLAFADLMTLLVFEWAMLVGALSAQPWVAKRPREVADRGHLRQAQTEVVILRPLGARVEHADAIEDFPPHQPEVERHEVDQQAVVRIKIPGGSDQKSSEHRAGRDQSDRPEARRECDDQEPEHKRGKKLQRNGIIRLRYHRAAQRAFQHLGVNLSPGMARDTGVVLMSFMPVVEVPISTSFLAILSAGTLPSSTSTAET